MNLTLNDIDGKSPGGSLHSIDPSCAHIVGIEAWVEAVDEDTTVPVHSEIHAWRHSGAVIHAEAHIGG